MNLPPRGERESATTTRYVGAFVLPVRRRRMCTAKVRCSSVKDVRGRNTTIPDGALDRHRPRSGAPEQRVDTLAMTYCERVLPEGADLLELRPGFLGAPVPDEEPSVVLAGLGEAVAQPVRLHDRDGFAELRVPRVEDALGLSHLGERHGGDEPDRDVAPHRAGIRG